MRRALYLVLALSVVVLGAAAFSNVPTALTAEDRTYIRRILNETGHNDVQPGIAQSLSFKEQVKLIQALQDAAFLATPKAGPIPLFHRREPEDEYLLKSRYCYDRSRLIEKLATYAGFGSRHISVFQATPGISFLALLVPRIRSHAVSEVLTTRGWMAVDSTSRWIGIGVNGNPVSFEEMQKVAWRALMPDSPTPILQGEFISIPGLYSRHGLFYPPYLPFPDYNAFQIWNAL